MSLGNISRHFLINVNLPDCFQMDLYFLFFFFAFDEKNNFEGKGLPGVEISSFGRADGFSRFFFYFEEFE